MLLLQEPVTWQDDGVYVTCEAGPTEGLGPSGGPGGALLERLLRNEAPRFEHYEGFDLICVAVSEILGPEKGLPVVIIFSRQSLRFFCRTPAKVEALLEELAHDGLPDLSPGQLLASFFERLLRGDLAQLETLETAVSALEDRALSGQAEESFPRKIMALKKRLLAIRRYYDQLTDLFECLLQNENGLLDRRCLGALRILRGRVGRLQAKATSLRETVTELRETYQAAVDTRMNRTMQLFTVITIIFMPLTLITGWFGMNVQIPAFSSPFGYPLVIGLSAGALLLSVWLCRRRHWL